MLTMVYTFRMDLSFDYILNKYDKLELLDENKGKDKMYLKFLKLLLKNKNVTVLNLVRGWRDVTIFDLELTRVKYQKEILNQFN